MERLTDLVLRHRRLVVLVWLVLTTVGFGVAGKATEAMDQRFSVPGREGWDTSVEIVERYGNGGDALPLLAVVELPAGARADTPAASGELRAVETTMRDALPGARVTGFGSTGDRAFLSQDGRVAFAYAFPAPSADPFGGNGPAAAALEQALAGMTVGGAPVHSTGYDALNEGAGEGEGPGVLIEALVAGLAALVVLAFVFGSALAFAPLLIAVCAIPASFLMLLGIGTATDLSPILQFLVPLIGLGISIDYALLIVVRWREEFERGGSSEDAVRRAMATAGHSVVFSGTTVAVGLLALVVMPLPFLRSMGYGGLLIPLAATSAAVTLLPVVLARFGPLLDRRRLRRRAIDAPGAWDRWAGWVVRRRALAALAGSAVLIALLVPALDLNLGNPDPNTMAKTGEAKSALVALDRSGIGTGAIAPTETLVRERDAGAVRAAQAAVPGVHGAVAPAGAEWHKDGDAIVVAIPQEGDESSPGRASIAALIDAAHGASESARVGGSGPLNRDFIDAVYGSFPLLVLVLSLLTFVLLARAFRSLLLPLKAVLLNVFSIAATLGVMALVWQDGHGSDELFGVAATGSIVSWIPFMVFALLYGLSMDYEVFILSRMREAYDAGATTDEAVVVGLGRTGRLVTSAALILFFAFAALSAGPQVDLKILATGLAAGILLDATIIRAFLVPATVSLLGEWNWWMPQRAARLLRVEPSPRRSGAAT